MICFHLVSQISFFLQADGLISLSRNSGGIYPSWEVGSEYPCTRLAHHLPPSLGSAPCSATCCSSGSCTGVMSPLLSSWQGGGPASCSPPASPYAGAPSLCVAVTPNAILCPGLPDAAPPATQQGKELVLSLHSHLSGFASPLGVRQERCRPTPWQGCCPPQSSEGRVRRAVWLAQLTDGGLGNQNIRSPNCVILASPQLTVYLTCFVISGLLKPVQPFGFLFKWGRGRG